MAAMIPSSPAPVVEPVHVVTDGLLGRLRVWDESEWAELPEGSRPVVAEHVPGLGWVGLEPSSEWNN